MWPKDTENASGIPHGDRNAALSGEARSRVGYQAELDHLRGADPHAPSVAELRKRLEVRQGATALDADRD